MINIKKKIMTKNIPELKSIKIIISKKPKT